jgi:hypothetical protein
VSREIQDEIPEDLNFFLELAVIIIFISPIAYGVHVITEQCSMQMIDWEVQPKGAAIQSGVER